MVAFFFVAERVERFLHTENILPSGFVSFDFDETVLFWLLSTWFFLFLLVDSLIFYSLGFYSRLPTPHEREIWVSAVIDVVIVSTCLTVFYVAEAKRCCDPDAARQVLAGADEAREYPYYGPAPCNCPKFGERLYGGLGTIEPYTSLLALRLFRFWTATFVVRRLDNRQGKSPTNEDEQDEIDEDAKLDPFDVYNSNDVHGHGHGEEEKGTAAELWEATVGRHPELVAKHGEYSREVLMAMLGIPIVEEISSEAPLESHVRSSPRSDETGRTPVSPLSSRMPSFQFEEQPNDLPIDDEQESEFGSPNATLVRSMRRADRKLLPILNSWTAVDVVMTRFEMVYFDATNVDNEVFLSNPVVEAARTALIRAKGGKGLTLRDVAVGRRVVGRFSLSETTSIAVEREMPCESVRSGDELSNDVAQTEYWTSGADANSTTPRSSVWHKIKQDTLRVQTNHGHTLYLRFYSDLDEATRHPERMAEENELEGPLYKNNAFQWAQTIARQCGPERLKQQLPHFGDNSDDELRDYLVIKSEEERKGHRRGISRAFAFQMRKYPSAGDDAVLSDDSGNLALAGRLRQRLRRVSSAAELETAAKVVALDPTPDNLSTSLTGLPDTMESGLSREVADRERISVVESSSQNSFTRLSLSTVCEATSQCKEVTTTPRETSKNMPQPPVEGYYEAHAEEAS